MTSSEDQATKASTESQNQIQNCYEPEYYYYDDDYYNYYNDHFQKNLPGSPEQDKTSFYDYYDATQYPTKTEYNNENFEKNPRNGGTENQSYYSEHNTYNYKPCSYQEYPESSVGQHDQRYFQKSKSISYNNENNQPQSYSQNTISYHNAVYNNYNYSPQSGYNTGSTNCNEKTYENSRYENNYDSNSYYYDNLNQNYARKPETETLRGDQGVPDEYSYGYGANYDNGQYYENANPGDYVKNAPYGVTGGQKKHSAFGY